MPADRETDPPGQTLFASAGGRKRTNDGVPEVGIATRAVRGVPLHQRRLKKLSRGAHIRASSV